MQWMEIEIGVVDAYQFDTSQDKPLPYGQNI